MSACLAPRTVIHEAISGALAARRRGPQSLTKHTQPHTSSSSRAYIVCLVSREWPALPSRVHMGFV